MIGIDDHGGQDTNDGSVLFRYRPVRWPRASWPLRCTHGGHRPRPSAHATAEKEQQPVRASGGSPSPAAAARRASYCATTMDGSANCCWRCSSGSFFSGDRSLDRPGVDVEIELLPNQLASSRARTGSPATSCCWTNASAWPRSLCGPRGPRFCGTSPATPPLSKLALV